MGYMSPVADDSLYFLSTQCTGLIYKNPQFIKRKIKVNIGYLGSNRIMVHLVYLPQDYLGWHNADGGLLYYAGILDMGIKVITACCVCYVSLIK